MLEMTENKSRININLQEKREYVGDGQYIKFGIAPTIIPHPELVIQFPNALNKSDIKAHKYRDLSKLDKDIEARLQCTKIDAKFIGHVGDNRALKMSITYDGRCFALFGVRNEHTYYVYWLSSLIFYNAQGYTGDPLVNIPALFEWDGLGCLLTVLPLYPRTVELVPEPLQLTRVKQVSCPSKVPLFTNERISERGSTFKTVSEKDAEYMIKNVILEYGDDIVLPLEEQSVDEDGNDELYLIK